MILTLFIASSGGPYSIALVGIFSSALREAAFALAASIKARFFATGSIKFPIKIYRFVD